MAPELLIFDCDGVLIDSEMLTIRIGVALLAEAGIEITGDEILDRYCGISMPAMLADLEQRYRRPLGNSFAARHSAELAALFEAELQPMPGIEAALNAVTTKACVASSSSPERLRHTLGLAGLYRRFDPHVFSATMVARGKPAPDLFLFAAEQMRVAPDKCVVIEDSLPGVAAAAAAGMATIGFVGGSHCRPGLGDRLRGAGAAVVVGDMAELLPALAALPARLR
jgi:HAD superfamily hydrolase (TIGR01509 family)